MTDTLTVAQAILAYGANPNLDPVSVMDSTQNVSNGIDNLQTLTAHGKLVSISLTDNDRVMVNTSQLPNDAPTLDLVTGLYRLQINPLSLPRGSFFGSYTFASNVNDVYIPYASSATVVGSDIFNTIIVGSDASSSANITVRAGDGGCYISVTALGSALFLLESNNAFFGGAGGGTGGAGNTIYTSGGNNYLQGGQGSPSDVLVANGDGNNTIFGGSGNNYIVGGTRTNMLVGGSGPSNVIVENGAGTDNKLWGGPGTNYMVGGIEEDLIVGGNSSNDYLFGNAGADTLYGRGGTDYLYPGAGNDLIWTDDAGTQLQDFIYESPGTGIDTFNDFTPGDIANHDVLVISGSASLRSFADVQAQAVPAGAYTVLPVSASDIVFLYNVQPFQLTGNNFIFN